MLISVALHYGLTVNAGKRSVIQRAGSHSTDWRKSRGDYDIDLIAIQRQLTNIELVLLSAMNLVIDAENVPKNLMPFANLTSF